jgi:acyl-CoA reductase-like NAD-dependent aldehyde dehydrogenase
MRKGLPSPPASEDHMRLFIPTMDAFLVEFDSDGRVRLDEEEWSKPSVQERRAIIHAAKDELESLKELLDVLESQS